VVRGRDSLTGALLVGGASRRFGSPKALAELEGESLAERGHRLLSQTCDTVIVVGKAGDRLDLPFEVLDDGSEERAAVVGVAAALRLAASDLVLVLPTDMPWVTADALLALAAGADEVDAAVPQTGPLPGAYRRSVLPVLERRIAAGDFALHRALEELSWKAVEVDPSLLGNVNTPGDLVFGAARDS
jgi:molybdopterin-guanine dinucleotide biosynthesis protein A